METNDYHYNPAQDAGNTAPDGPPFDVTIIPFHIFRSFPISRFRCRFRSLPRVGHDCAGYIIHPKEAK